MAQQKPADMKIGALAEYSGVHVETIRYYQNLGLMPRPARVRGSVRRYGREAIDRLRFIKRAQGLGFTLEEVRLLLELSAGEHCAETRALAKQKKAVVDRKISDLGAIQAALEKMIRACSTGRKGQGCPIIESLSSDS